MELYLLAVVLFAVAGVLVGVGLAGLRERLPRNRWIGLHVESVQADGEAWRAGHRAAGGPLIAAAGPPLLLAVVLVVDPPGQVADWLLVYIVVGLVTGGLIALAVRQADRAARKPAGG